VRASHEDFRNLYAERDRLKAELDALRKGLQGEVERLRDEAAACRDEATKRRHTVTANLALGEGSAIDRRADLLSALLDSGGEG
jgi:F0F1-type ATP synthase membrane subunit b/b'